MALGLRGWGHRGFALPTALWVVPYPKPSALNPKLKTQGVNTPELQVLGFQCRGFAWVGLLPPLFPNPPTAGLGFRA